MVRVDASILLEPVRRLRRPPHDAPEPWRKAAASLRRLAWVLAGMVGVALAVWVFFVGVMASLFGGGDLETVASVAFYALTGTAVAALLYVGLAWAPASLYDRLRRGDASARWPARAMGVLLVPTGIVGFPLALLAATADFDSGWTFVPVFLTAALFGLGGPWLVVAGVRLVRLRRLARVGPHEENT